MRNNQPVTHNEYVLSDDTLIVSKTDAKGKLTYFNDQFVAASGFTDEELMGQPHNIVRHPDMPPEAFANLWDTLKEGKPWAGAVKNRRKNGDFYWVLASATPIWENGQITGYMSIRSKLPADQREEAEHVYALLRAKKAQAYKVEAGMIRRRSLADRVAFFTRTLQRRLATLVATFCAFMLLIGAGGLVATYQTNQKAKTIYEDRTIPLAQLFEINDRMKDSFLTLYGAAADGRAGKPVGDAASRVATNTDAISKVWAEYVATYLTPEEKLTADAFVPKRRDYVESGLKPAVALLAEGKFDDLSAHLTGKMTQLFAAAKQDADKLVAIQVKEAKYEFDVAERFYATSIMVAIAAMAGGLLLSGWMSLLTMRAIGRPLERLNSVMSGIGRGEYNNRVIVERDDELGAALRNIQAVQAKLGFDRVSQKDIERRTIEQRKVDMHRLADDFENAIGEIINTVSSASTELEATASTLTHTADLTQELSGAVAAASEEASANVQSVASATEEMSSSVNEIGRQVEESTKIASEAVRQAHETDVRITALSQAATRIGDVVNLITTIAEQTNLLALNATIEAARAGEAGRGFAVVASEVKSLATQTAKATSEISIQISGMQSATRDSVTSIHEIGGTIGRISEIAATIAAAVEEQGAATSEIARNVQEAAAGTGEVASKITDVNRGAGETGAASAQVLSSAQQLSSESNRLKSEVAKFLATVRAA